LYFQHRYTIACLPTNQYITMHTTNNAALQQFKNMVGVKFQLYNSLFTSLPFHRIEKTGILVSLLLINCEEGYQKKQSPEEIIEAFFATQTSFIKEEEKIDLLFLFVQYIERQVVLFDALEDASFTQVNDMGGNGTLKQLAVEVDALHTKAALKEKLQDFTIQLVLTAHPTQFYRGAVLGIIHDISKAVNSNNENQIYTYLEQLGRTPFFQHTKPTPYDEAVSLIWYLENVFYQAAGRITGFLKSRFGNALNANNSILKMGFWPGGDRDGNPFVKADTTLNVAHALRGAAVKCYYLDIRKLKRRLTFKGVDVALAQLEKKLYDHVFVPGHNFNLSKEEIVTALKNISYQLVYNHNSLFVAQVENLINKVEVFGLHFASLDVRQDSSIHTKTIEALVAAGGIFPSNYAALTNNEKIEVLASMATTCDKNVLEDDVQRDVLEAMAAVKIIQQLNGEAGCNRYIISQCNSALNAMEVYGLFLLSGWQKEDLSVDIIPLFETIDDLQEAAAIMEQLYTNHTYTQHLQRRGNKQTIMLGFSDGTKDGGYLMANWSIYKAKEQLTAISKKYEIDVVFFDGRGGPPARGGGKTHNFYASLGKNISNKEIQLTIQGQTVSSNFGTIDAAQYNIEQLLHAGISNSVINKNETSFTTQQEQLINALAVEGHNAYAALKNHPQFTNYLLHASPLRFYSETNIGSRPAKRGASATLELKDLRAIPFVGAWSQLKQNVTGFYGVGFALEKIANDGKWMEIKQLYDESLFFKTLIDNCEMAMKKCFFPLTAFLANHATYGKIWNKIHDEFERTKSYVALLTGNKELMANYPVDQLSIEMRERIVLPLLTIQQYAITKVRTMEEASPNALTKASYEKLVMRCSFGIINAGRNSA
jgi:phosphoenolpyruvate carboxylase